jgi:endonuclease I
MPNHLCPIDRCNHSLPQHLLMCSRHWRLVPRQLQQKVYAAWNRGEPRQNYVAIRSEAIRCVNEQLQPKGRGDRNG